MELCQASLYVLPWREIFPVEILLFQWKRHGSYERFLHYPKGFGDFEGMMSILQLQKGHATHITYLGEATTISSALVGDQELRKNWQCSR